MKLTGMGLVVLALAALFPIASLTMTAGCPASTGEGEGEGEGEGAAGEGEGEGAAGEGEGEGQGGCAGDDTALGAGGGTITVTDANLAADATNAACTAGGTNACDAAGGSCFSFDITVTGSTAAAIDGNNAHWVNWKTSSSEAAFGAAQTFCNGGAVGCSDDATNSDTVCSCGLCLGAAPSDLAAQVNDGTSDSNGFCVNIQ